MKTIKEYAEKRWEDSQGEFSVIDFIAGVKYALRWIPIEEQLPERKFELSSGKILVKTDKGIIDTSFYDFDLEIFTILEHQGEVTHWKPIDIEI